MEGEGGGCVQEECEGGVWRGECVGKCVTVVQLYAESDCFFTHARPTLTTESLNG